MTAASPGYTDGFYSTHRSSSRASADVVVGLLAELGLRPEAGVLDIGCGRGDWLDAFAAAGVSRLVGVDGEWNEASFMGRAEIEFRGMDLEALTADKVLGPATEPFGLAMSVEVAEHLSPEAGEALVQVLTRAAPVVMFSAAVPGQGGTSHRNEQWPSYWVRRFAAHGYDVWDVLRRKLWDDDRVTYWYRQNVLLFAPADTFSPGITTPCPLDIVHPELLLDRRRSPLPGDWTVGSVRLARQELKRRIGRLVRR
jgi:SAM-dependent methyltransferase